MSIPFSRLVGTKTAMGCGLYATREDNEQRLKDFAEANNYIPDSLTSNTWYKRAREYYYHDTTQSVARPTAQAVNDFTAWHVENNHGNIPIFTDTPSIIEWNEGISPNQLNRRGGMGSLDIDRCCEGIIEAGLLGITAIGVEGDFFVPWILDDT